MSRNPVSIRSGPLSEDRAVSIGDSSRGADVEARLGAMIGIAGIPGSGKTTLAETLVEDLNRRAKHDLVPNEFPFYASPAISIPMDGFHLPRLVLSAMSDPTEAHARRGAPFTFDVPMLISLIHKLRQSIPPPGTEGDDEGDSSRTILAPSFDHAIKDPKDDDIAVLPSHRIIFIEGSYLALDKEVWRDGAALLDELWFVEVDFEVARCRLRERHLQAGIVSSLSEGDKRALENDLVNGDEVLQYRLPVDEVIQSLDEGPWDLENCCT
ncbi:hypothetical protein E4U61_006545 [Claviceps capensis]|nr:hypothetical protein E4U61_006545 [Claviceps capensis]